ncbi:uncharacterized protein LOC127010878 [Drosophila biarmipes]|uniref:uncharacterized protein LOC127010878 n=1 Tax=Drosophila biarmipes TaxID=125945 RepID=UPI0021CC860F|nr:uncharacterized protein LOC127010878 [Drosophila biarmipes]
MYCVWAIQSQCQKIEFINVILKYRNEGLATPAAKVHFCNQHTKNQTRLSSINRRSSQKATLELGYAALHNYARLNAKSKSCASYTTIKIMTSLRISTWNAIGVSQHKLMLAQLLLDNQMLSETHLTNKYNCHLRGYLFYRISHQMVKHIGGLEF